MSTNNPPLRPQNTMLMLQKHPPPRMTNTFLSLAKKKLQACYHMQDFGQLLEYAMGDDGHHGVYYDYKHAFQM
jgi:hypothetical protein